MKIQARLIGAFEALLLALTGALTIALLIAIFQPVVRGDDSQRSGRVVAEHSQRSGIAG